ncbi:hypothetical protein [Phenylobacterium sp. J367]|uniref:hypothetical protein n=1 Tax=Phenylobacterium sp. J367 TaxID=2898435 RepID=UPI002150B508|nr:hypothetical protein [Phenylobacterium sp. J367]MCR5877363.1 hypothetical protein [Phenylobacterium sp. J367]
MRPAVLALLLATAAAPAVAAPVPADVAAAVKAAEPRMTITEAELKERDGRRYYDVEGTLPDGSEIELDMLQTPEGWQVVEIQRDIPWAAAPAPVRAAVPTARPVRVIESKQTDGSVIYELFAEGQPKDPAIEVQWESGQAKVLEGRWPH